MHRTTSITTFSERPPVSVAAVARAAAAARAAVIASGVLLFTVSAQAADVSAADAREARMEVAEDCTRPETPTVPDGATAEMDEMAEASTAVREFVSGTQAYLACLERKEAAYGAGITPAQQAVIVAIYNQSVDAMQTTAERFNTELGEFRARGE